MLYLIDFSRFGKKGDGGRGNRYLAFNPVSVFGLGLAFAFPFSRFAVFRFCRFLQKLYRLSSSSKLIIIENGSA